MDSRLFQAISFLTEIKPILFFVGGLMVLGSLGQLALNREAYLYSNSPSGKVNARIDPSYGAFRKDLHMKVINSSVVLVFGAVILLGSSVFLGDSEDKQESIIEQEKLLGILKKRLAKGEISLDYYDELRDRILR